MPNECEKLLGKRPELARFKKRTERTAVAN